MKKEPKTVNCKHLEHGTFRRLINYIIINKIPMNEIKTWTEAKSRWRELVIMMSGNEEAKFTAANNVCTLTCIWSATIFTAHTLTAQTSLNYICVYVWFYYLFRCVYITIYSLNKQLLY